MALLGLPAEKFLACAMLCQDRRKTEAPKLLMDLTPDSDGYYFDRRAHAFPKDIRHHELSKEILPHYPARIDLLN